MLVLFPKDLLSDFPMLLLDLDALDDNCLQIARRASGKTIRIATKSVRSVEVLKRILDSSIVYQGLMSYSPEEAIFLSEKGFDDILLGYPCWEGTALRKIATAKTRIILMVDSPTHISYLQEIAEEVSGHFQLCMDIDMSTKFPGLHFGVRRSPINNAHDALELAKQIKNASHLELVGIMGYEAQIAGVGDQVPAQHLKNHLITFLKNKSITEVGSRRNEIVQTLRKNGFPLPLVNGGGTGSLQTTSTEETVTEVTVGSGFYSPLLFDYYKDFRYKPALFFSLPIVRKPTPQIYTCLGGGYIASGATGPDKAPQPVYPPGGKLLPLEGAGEVQTPVFFGGNIDLEIGDSIVFRAAKAGEICERFNEITCFSKGKIVTSFKTYRGEGVCFL